jgi:hypothetical protein
MSNGRASQPTKHFFRKSQEGAESEKRESKKQNSGIRFMDSIASRKISIPI